MTESQFKAMIELLIMIERNTRPKEDKVEIVHEPMGDFVEERRPICTCAKSPETCPWHGVRKVREEEKDGK